MFMKIPRGGSPKPRFEMCPQFCVRPGGSSEETGVKGFGVWGLGLTVIAVEGAGNVGNFGFGV